MANFKVKTKNQLELNKKPRVYFTCHPEDFEKSFEKICEDIFSTHDCAIYYTEDMSKVIDEDEKEVDLARSNLFVVPVTYKLLSTPNRAMDEDIPYAFEQHIPILPIMMVSGIDVLYSKPDKFGELQYLNPYSTDLTEISYKEKLKKYLESVLISDEMAKRVRAAFDAYIFLSYRKKDRKYANELMRLIHSNPECRDIAIWFDEFLTPGESFKEGIDKILKDSNLFALLVTPNLLEEPDGKPNFVMGEEYPAAKKSGITILPAEMVETDEEALDEKFEDIPACIRPNDAEFHSQLLESITRAATEVTDTPDHNFLIGLAYLDGIDVEVNREIALELITSSAQAGLPEAMHKLYEMYNKGIGVELDYRKAVIWAEKLADYMSKVFGEEHLKTLESLHNLALVYDDLSDNNKALKLQKKVYKLCCKVLGEEHPNTLDSLNNLAYTYGKLGQHKKAFELNEKAYALSCKVFGDEHPQTLMSLNNLAYIYGELGNYHKELELNEKVYALSCKVLGEEHPQTLMSLNNFASTCGALGDHEKAFGFNEKAYMLHCKVWGEEHPNTLTSLGNLASNYGCLGDHHKELELNEKVYAFRCKVLGEEHLDTLEALCNLAHTYYELYNYEKAVELYEKLYSLSCIVFGEEHSDTLISLNNLAYLYGELGDYKKAAELYEKMYSLNCIVLGEEHPDILTSLNNLAYTYGELGNHQKELENYDKIYTICCKLFGEEHHDTLISLSNLALTYGDLGDYQKALELNEKAYTLCCKMLGEEHPDTIKSRERIAEIKKLLE